MKLNKIEKLKRQLSPYDFGAKLEKLDLNALDEAQRFYLKNYGIYNIKLRPESFMLRLRISAGRIIPEKLLFIARLARRYGLSTLITARAQLELHGLHSGNVLVVWQALRDEGITTLQTLTDNFRNIVTDPLDGLQPGSRIEVYPLIEQMQALILGKEEWMGMLPRKCNTAICGSEETPQSFMHNDIFFALAQKEGCYGFNLYLGGKNSEAARDADIFVAPEDVVAMFEAVGNAFKTYGLRASRSKARLFHLLEEIGMDEFRGKIALFYPHTLQTKGTFMLKKRPPTDTIRLYDGTLAQCLRSRFGEIDPGMLEEAANIAQRESLQVRLGIDQNLYLCGLKEMKRFAPVEGACDVQACAGSRYCALSLWEVKSETSYLPLDLIEKYHIRVGFSGCLKGCGHHQHADIGLIGLRTNLFGPTQKAARVFLGALYSGEVAQSARLLYYVVPLEHLDALMRVIIAEFESSGREDFELFTKEVLSRYSDAFLTLWFLAKLTLEKEIVLRGEEEALRESLQRDLPLSLSRNAEDDTETVRQMMHILWDTPSL